MIELPNQLAWLLGVFYYKLIEWGVKENEVFEQFGMTLEQLIETKSSVTIDQFKHLGEIAQRLTNRPDIGLILGKNAELDENQGGFVLNIALNSPTIRHFVQELTKLSALFKDILTFSLIEKKDICQISIDFFKAGDMGRPAVEFYLSGYISTLRHIIGSEFLPIRIDFPYPAPQYIEAYNQTFKTRLMFDQEKAVIVFYKKYLDLPTPRPVSIVKEILSRIVDDYLIEMKENALFQTKIRKLIVKRLPSGEVGIESIADELKISRGVIYRKLKKEKTSYKQVLTLTRKQLAKEYLKNPSLNIDMIASRLGYTESSAFKRAFKGWFGINPGQYRRQGQQNS